VDAPTYCWMAKADIGNLSTNVEYSPSPEFHAFAIARSACADIGCRFQPGLSLEERWEQLGAVTLHIARDDVGRGRQRALGCATDTGALAATQSRQRRLALRAGRVIQISPLLKELLRRVMDAGTLDKCRVREGRLIDILVDELTISRGGSIELPMPRHARAVPKSAGASVRTLERLFNDETGLRPHDSIVISAAHTVMLIHRTQLLEQRNRFRERPHPLYRAVRHVDDRATIARNSFHIRAMCNEIQNHVVVAA